MAVIDETWTLRRECDIIVELSRGTGRAVCDWPLESDASHPSEEDGKLLASVPELLRKIRDLEQELDAARDG